MSARPSTAPPRTAASRFFRSGWSRRLVATSPTNGSAAICSATDRRPQSRWTATREPVEFVTDRLAAAATGLAGGRDRAGQLRLAARRRSGPGAVSGVAAAGGGRRRDLLRPRRADQSGVDRDPRTAQFGGESDASSFSGRPGWASRRFCGPGCCPGWRRDDRHFLPMDIVRPQRHPLTGQHGLARSIHALRAGLGLAEPAFGRDQGRCRRPGAGAGLAGGRRSTPRSTRFLATVPGRRRRRSCCRWIRPKNCSAPTPAEEAGEFLTTVAGLLRDGQPAAADRGGRPPCARTATSRCRPPRSWPGWSATALR